MQLSFSGAKFDADIERQNTFILGGPSDGEIRLQAAHHSKERSLTMAGRNLRSVLGKERAPSFTIPPLLS